MSLKMRAYKGEEDYWRIREFLREVFSLNNYRELSWQTYRFDYFRWHVNENIHHFRLQEVLYIWDSDDDRIAGVLNPENKGEACLQIHPHLRTTQLEVEMLDTAEQHLAINAPNGQRRLRVWADADDELRKEILVKRGFTNQGGAEFQRRRSMSEPIPDQQIAQGYTVRALGDLEELPARSWLSWKAFHPDAPDENYEGWEWYLNIQRAPLYRRDLDIVAAAADGELASFCTVWFDDVTRSGAFEPVGTAPAHQRRGLGKAVMSAGLRHLKRLGARWAFVSSYSAEAHALYSSMGFVHYGSSEPWVKEW
jgi:GNAT superfamily N-acetyltransferase